MQRAWLSQALCIGGCDWIGLEADEANFPAWIVDCEKPNPFAANADIVNVDTEHFQTIFQLFQGEVVLVYHDCVSLLGELTDCELTDCELSNEVDL